MMIHSKTWLVPVTFLIMLTSGCGDDSSGSDSGSAAGSYSNFDGVLTAGGGLITGFGSVMIDGITYHTTDATIKDIDGTDMSAEALEVGMRVDFEAKLGESDDTGFLSQLVIRDQVSGKVDSVDVTAHTIYIFGDEILYNEDTVFTNMDSENVIVELANGVHVSVSGYRDSAGVLTATLIRKLDPTTATSTIEGPISNLNESSKTFKIRKIPFSYQASQDPDGMLAVGQVAKVTFTYNSDGST